MKRFLWWQILLCPSIVIKAIIAFAICCASALVYMAVFGDGTELPMTCSILLLIGSIVASEVIVNKFSRRKK